MNKENRLWKWVLIVVLVGSAGLAVYPPQDKLKPGIDLAGGTSLIYEIDMSGLAPGERQNLAQRVMDILKARVDPNSQFNLVWRPIGNNRLEIQMPRPPKEARARREAYKAARDVIRDTNVTKTEMAQALALTGAARDAALAALVNGVDGRAERIAAAAKAWDAYAAARGSGDIEAEINAQAAYETALDAVLETSLQIGRLTDVLGLRGSEREKEIDRLKQEYPSYISAIDPTIKAYDAWIKKRGSLEDPADLKRLLRGAGVLEFRILASRDPANPTMLENEDASLREPVAKYTEQLSKRGPRPKAGDQYEWFEVDDFVKFMQAKTMKEAEARRPTDTTVVEKYAGKYYVLAHVDAGDERFGLTQNSPRWSLKRAFPNRDRNNRPCVDFTLDPRGGQQFANMTRQNIGRQLAIFLDGVATSHATILTQISERGQITGGFSRDRVMEIVRRLEAGSLPARLKEQPLQEKNTGPSLGKRNRDMGMRAAVYGFLAVAGFMLAYYWFAGVLADIALVLNLLFVLAIMAAMEATFTLPGIAGLILTVGMAVDANVLIFERIREERERGVGLKKAVKTGYDKAFSTIVDANLTTLITCIILAYVGSEEVKGFATTLGFGVVTSMFTALFVTRLILTTLMDKGIVKSLPMAQMVGRPNINWVGLRSVFWPVSTTLVAVGLGAFAYVSVTDKEAIYDIEFLGGTSVQIELADGVDMTAEEVRKVVTGVGSDQDNATNWLRNAAAELRNATVAPGETSGEYTITCEKLASADVNVLMHTAFADSLAMGGYTGQGKTSRFVTKAKEVYDPDAPGDVIETPVDLEAFKAGVESAVAYVEKSAERLASARIQTVSDVGDKESKDRAFEIITVESDKDLVRSAILGVMGDKLKIQRRIEYVLATDPQSAPLGMYPILEEYDFLGQVIGEDNPTDVRPYKGGVVLVFDQLKPVQTLEAINTRFREMRLQPQFEKYEAREYQIVGLEGAGKDADGVPMFSRFGLMVGDESLIYGDDPLKWEERLAKPELEQAEEALSAEKTLRKVVQFAPQIASQTQQRALIALVLALSAIVAYIWIRFGTMQYGLAAIVALVHDVSIVLGMVTIADYFGIGDFRIDLAMIAALLTVVGYSLNDTIVVFDRIRENRGKLSSLSTNIINNSINMTLSRTLLTSVTTLLAVLFLYTMGGPGVRGFAFALLAGVIVGTYSSIGIAAPLLQNRKLLHVIMYALLSVTAIGITAVSTHNETAVLVVGAVVAAVIVFAITIERRLDQPVRAAA